IYRDGVLVAANRDAIPNIKPDKRNVRILAHHASSRLGEPMAHLDNLIVWAQAKTDFSSRFNENPEHDLVLWNKLGTVGEVANSEVGPGIQQISYRYSAWQEARLEPGRFGNGLFVNHDINEGWANDGGNFFVTDLGQTSLTPNRGTVEFWFKFKYGSDTHNHAYFFDTRNVALAHYPDQNWNTDFAIAAGWNGWTYTSPPSGKRFFFSLQTAGGQVVQVMTPDFSAGPGGRLAFENGTLMHFAFVWDVSGIDGTADTMRIYVNGKVEGATQQSWTPGGRFDRYLFIGSAPNCCNWDHHYNAVKGVTDNLIIWNSAKTNFANRFSENPLYEVVLWNKMGNLAQVTNSEVGPGFAFRPGVSFVTGRYGGALATQGGETGGGGYLTMSPQNFFGADNRQGTVEVWIKKRIPRAIPYETPLVAIFGIQNYDLITPGDSGYESIFAYWSDGFTGSGGMEFTIKDSNNVDHRANDLSWDNVPVNQWVHMAFVWDLNGIEGSPDRMRIYRDGVLVAANRDCLLYTSDAAD
ncbi:MAG: LamG domain-containing protein, partial [Verrucomicrobiae bacterium]|nr:LamG domain-containing protein [Verrucomicrobiae bacterium]